MKKRISTTLVEKFFRDFSKEGRIKEDLCNIRTYHFISECKKLEVEWYVLIFLNRDGSRLGEKESWRGHVAAGCIDGGEDVVLDPLMVQDPDRPKQAVSVESWINWFQMLHTQWGHSLETLVLVRLGMAQLEDAQLVLERFDLKSEGGKFLEQICTDLKRLPHSVDIENQLDPHIVAPVRGNQFKYW